MASHEVVGKVLLTQEQIWQRARSWELRSPGITRAKRSSSSAP